MRWWRPKLAVASLLGGAVATVGVSWFIARYIDEHSGGWDTVSLDRVIPERWPPGAPDNWSLSAASREVKWTRHRDLFYTIDELTAGSVHSSNRYTIISVGFPFAALQKGRCSYSNMAAFPEFGSWPVDGPWGGYPVASPRTRPQMFEPAAPLIPIIPAWPGFALNTLVYGGLCYAVGAFIFASISWRRLAHGRCGRCKYPIGVSPMCTECGEPVRSVPSPKA